MRPNVLVRERAIRLREIHNHGETAQSRTVAATVPEAAVSVGGMDSGGNFQRFGRVGVDRIGGFRVGGEG